jgi:hypothetical protein
MGQRQPQFMRHQMGPPHGLQVDEIPLSEQMVGRFMPELRRNQTAN